MTEAEWFKLRDEAAAKRRPPEVEAKLLLNCHRCQDGDDQPHSSSIPFCCFKCSDWFYQGHNLTELQTKFEGVLSNELAST